MTQFGPKLAFLSIAGSFGALLVGWLVVVAWAVSRKTPIYFISVQYFELFNIINSVSGGSNVKNWKSVNIVNSVQAVYSPLLPPSPILQWYLLSGFGVSLDLQMLSQQIAE